MRRSDTIASNITSARESLGITRYEAARRMGVSRTAWNYWEKGLHEPNRPSLERIASVLRITYAELIGIDEPKPKNKRNTK